MKISIIIATYNAARTLRQALDSIKYQTYKDIETIVIDGKSTDDTLNIIQEYNDVVTKWISEKDYGIYDAFNKGVDLATGDYIAFLGSDDCYCNYSIIERVISDINENVEMLSAPVVVVNEDSHKEEIGTNTYNIDDIFSGCMLPHQGIFVKTSTMKKYHFSLQNKIISDYEFLVRFIKAGGKIKFVDYPVVYYSNGGLSSSIERGDKKWCNLFLEHIYLAERLHISKKYTYKMLRHSMLLDEVSSKYYLKELTKIVLKRIGIFNIVKSIIKRTRFHSCTLNYCRWCGRYGK